MIKHDNLPAIDFDKIAWLPLSTRSILLADLDKGRTQPMINWPKQATKTNRSNWLH
jgi:hypothetical protein